MKVSELRIGNFVKDKNAQYKTVNGFTQILATGIYQFHLEKLELDALPLTEEWLLKFGFEYNKRGNWNRYFKEGIYPRSFAFQFYKNGRIDFWYGDFNVGNLNRIKYNPLQYVHQLQNLYFALTGKELEYEQN
jgi:hypothetical protein